METVIKFDQKFIDFVERIYPGTTHTWQDRGDGFWLYFPTGLVLSIQFGPGSWCSNHNTEELRRVLEHTLYKDYSLTAVDAEIAYWTAERTQLQIFPDTEDTVRSYTTPGYVLHWIREHVKC